MKELSIEEKAKRYDEALEKSKRLYEQGTITESLAYIFPELKESEDERIRKAMIEMVHDTTGDSLWIDYNVHKEDAIAWLEKQGEKKSQRMVSAEVKEAMYDKPAWSEEDEHRVKDTIYFLDTAKKHYASTIEIDACIDWIKSIKQRIGG